MKLIVFELGLDGDAAVLKQDYTPIKNVDLQAVRAHLMISGSPTGTITMEIHDANDKLIKASSETHTITDLTTLAHANKMIRFNFDIALKGNTKYRFVLKSAGGYTYAAASFVGWCAHSELRRVPLTSGFLGGGFGEPKGLEFWTRAETVKGVA